MCACETKSNTSRDNGVYANPNARTMTQEIKKNRASGIWYKKRAINRCADALKMLTVKKKILRFLRLDAAQSDPGWGRTKGVIRGAVYRQNTNR